MSPLTVCTTTVPVCLLLGMKCRESSLVTPTCPGCHQPMETTPRHLLESPAFLDTPRVSSPTSSATACPTLFDTHAPSSTHNQQLYSHPVSCHRVLQSSPSLVPEGPCGLVQRFPVPVDIVQTYPGLGIVKDYAQPSNFVFCTLGP